MAKHLRSTDGSNADNGSTWALAKANLLNSVLVAGETVYVSQVHNEVNPARIDVTYAGTPANPNYVLCGSDSASPPTSDAETAVVSTTGQASLNLFGSAYVRGITFICGNGSKPMKNAPSAKTIRTRLQLFQLEAMDQRRGI